jgi:hypothetical protein
MDRDCGEIPPHLGRIATHGDQRHGNRDKLANGHAISYAAPEIVVDKFLKLVSMEP